MRISDWSSDVCSSDLQPILHPEDRRADQKIAHGAAADPGDEREKGERDEGLPAPSRRQRTGCGEDGDPEQVEPGEYGADLPRSEEHTSELQSLMRSSYAVFCLKNKKQESKNKHTHIDTDL